MKHKFAIVAFLVVGFVYSLVLVSSRSPLIVDDVYPGNDCGGLLEKADVLYIIPDFGGSPIDDVDWCAKIGSLGKDLGLHGITHSYHEFGREVSSEDLASAVDSFEDCFGERPSLFRPPYNLISGENEDKVSGFNMTIYKKRFAMHPYCHCGPGSFMRVLNWILFC